MWKIEVLITAFFFKRPLSHVIKTKNYFCIFQNRRYDSVINRLYTGIQCYSCGMRFTTSQTDVYADHLDWHYRQNRTEKDVSRKVTHRRWYYSLTVSNSCASELLAFKFYHSKSKLSN